MTFEIIKTMIEKRIKETFKNAEISHRRYVCPIFGTDFSEPELCGSGVLVKLKNKYFIVTASHVLDLLSDDRIAAIGINNKIIQLEGNFIKTIIKGNDGKYNAYDFAIKELTQNELNFIKNKDSTFMNLEKIPNITYDTKAFYCAHGYPNSENHLNYEKEYLYDAYGLTIYGKPNKEFDYDYFNISTDTHIAISYTKSSDPKGMSGGGLFVYTDPCDASKEYIAGILTHYFKDREAFLAIKTDCILAMLKKLYPIEFSEIKSNSKIIIDIIQ